MNLKWGLGTVKLTIDEQYRNMARDHKRWKHASDRKCEKKPALQQMSHL